MRTKNLEMLRSGKFAENPWGPVVELKKGQVHPFPLGTAETMIEAGSAKVTIETPDFEGMSRSEIAKFTMDSFGVKIDARKAEPEVLKMAIAAFEAATKGKYQRLAAGIPVTEEARVAEEARRAALTEEERTAEDEPATGES